jgi:hypothetical protein
MWLDKYKPRNILPWGVIIGCYTCCVLIMLGIRMRMSYENRMRDKEQAERSVSPARACCCCRRGTFDELQLIFFHACDVM